MLSKARRERTSCPSAGHGELMRTRGRNTPMTRALQLSVPCVVPPYCVKAVLVSAPRPITLITQEMAMSLHIKSDGTSTRIQFVLPDDIHDGPVSAVGTFNNWVPGAHKLVRRSNGTRSVSVAVPAGQAVKFRYLGAGGVWFDDEDADAITPDGSLINA
jgi:hypothetical protein